jgi:acetolactate synthase-1/2/3 large subunit
MGFGLPAALGARAARPQATVVCVDGDGSFAMTAQELATAVAEDLPLVVVVVNNGWLGMVRQWQDRFHGGRRSESLLGQAGPDIAALARAYGCEAATVEAADELGAALDAALAAGRPYVLDCRCTPDEECYPMLAPGAASRDVIELADVEEVVVAAR